MKLLVCIDDTDNPETQGTGKLSQRMTEVIEENHWGRCRAVSRHQLFVHDDIPYTSHNSAMCFGVDFTGDPKNLIDFSADFLEHRSAPRVRSRALRGPDRQWH